MRILNGVKTQRRRPPLTVGLRPALLVAVLEYHMSSEPALRIGIIGAGYGGLACALALHANVDAAATAASPKSMHHKNNNVHVRCFERNQHPVGREGGVTVPSAPAVLQSVGMVQHWDELRAESRSPRTYSVRELQRVSSEDRYA